VPATGAVLANGLVTHNSGRLEENADVVIGLYREDNEAEAMEVAGLKGRDVGTWKTVLRFDRWTQKLDDWANPDRYWDE